MKKKFEVEFTIDDVKAFKIAERLYDQFYNRKGLFEKYSMPEYIFPRNLKKGTNARLMHTHYDDEREVICTTKKRVQLDQKKGMRVRHLRICKKI